MKIKIALIGDYNKTVPAHKAIPEALSLSAKKLDIEVTFKWVATKLINDVSCLKEFDGIWCVPGSPYENIDGALLAIQYAREEKIPFLGTCGGFQHAVIEYARNVIDWKNAEHAETAPEAELHVISKLTCSLIEVQQPIVLISGTKIAMAYGTTSIIEGYSCNYGLNPLFEEKLMGEEKHPLLIAAHGHAGEVRAIELRNHPFFVATLFQPERTALKGELPLLVLAFVKAAIITAQASSRRGVPGS